MSQGERTYELLIARVDDRLMQLLLWLGGALAIIGLLAAVLPREQEQKQEQPNQVEQVAQKGTNGRGSGGGGGHRRSCRRWWRRLGKDCQTICIGSIGGFPVGCFVFGTAAMQLALAGDGWGHWQTYAIIGAAAVMPSVGMAWNAFLTTRGLKPPSASARTVLAVAAGFQTSMIAVGVISGVVFWGDLEGRSAPTVCLFVTAVAAVVVGMALCQRESSLPPDLVAAFLLHYFRTTLHAHSGKCQAGDDGEQRSEASGVGA
eukprot:SAG11_NODE_106_length_16423_cov_51.220840_28_plen_260_part_00